MYLSCSSDNFILDFLAGSQATVTVTYDGEAESSCFVSKDGKGTATYVTAVDGQLDSYQGDFGAGMRHGSGKYTFANPDAKGAYYEGAFKATHTDASPADGEDAPAVPVAAYHGGLPHGEGVFVYPDGSHYAGEFVEGKRHGRGATQCVARLSMQSLVV